jgi:hypothetical protein
MAVGDASTAGGGQAEAGGEQSVLTYPAAGVEHGTAHFSRIGERLDRLLGASDAPRRGLTAGVRAFETEALGGGVTVRTAFACLSVGSGRVGSGWRVSGEQRRARYDQDH